MHVESLLVTAANSREYADVIGDACRSTRPTKVFAAVAYATHSGVAELSQVMNGIPEWRSAHKRWLVGIDYCRSDPKALEHLERLNRSTVRVHDGQFVSGRPGCTPRVSYHPKLYIFTRGDESSTVVGSGNLSLTGLRIGIEAAASIRGDRATEVQGALRRFDKMWRGATPVGDIADVYEQRYTTLDNRTHPAPVEDDAAPPSAGTHGQLTPEQLRQLRVCENLWIEAGNLHENRGAGRPGNQLMLKRNSRVYFGFQAQELDIDTTIGSVSIRFGAHVRDDCSLRFSNNSMDVLTLPIPGQGGPPAYDQQTLLFKRIGVRRFDVSIVTGNAKATCKTKSKKIGAAFRMTSGREWGVF
jgi:HKD family nuclease